MTPKQQTHAYGLLSQFEERMLDKYEKGAKEHGGNLWDLSSEDLLDNAIDEAVDQVVYLLTLKEKLNGSR